MVQLPPKTYLRGAPFYNAVTYCLSSSAAGLSFSGATYNAPDARKSQLSAPQAKGHSETTTATNNWLGRSTRASHHDHCRSLGCIQCFQSARDQTACRSCSICSSGESFLHISSERSASSSDISGAHFAINHVGSSNRHAEGEGQSRALNRSTTSITSLLFLNTVSALPSQETAKRTTPIPLGLSAGSGPNRKRRDSPLSIIFRPSHCPGRSRL